MNKSLLAILALLVIGAFIGLAIYILQTSQLDHAKFDKQGHALNQRYKHDVDSIKSELRRYISNFDSLCNESTILIDLVIQMRRENDSLRKQLERCVQTKIIRHAENVYIGQ